MTKRNNNPFKAIRTWYVYVDGFDMLAVVGTTDQAKAAFRKMHNITKMPDGALITATCRG